MNENHFNNRFDASQLRLYEDFSKSRANTEVVEALQKQSEAVGRSQHVFQALHYLRKVNWLYTIFFKVSGFRNFTVMHSADD